MCVFGHTRTYDMHPPQIVPKFDNENRRRYHDKIENKYFLAYLLRHFILCKICIFNDKLEDGLFGRII